MLAPDKVELLQSLSPAARWEAVKRSLPSESETVSQIAGDIASNGEYFNTIYLPHLTNMARVQIFYGGSSSGKSVFLSQRTLIDVMSGRNYLICRGVAKTIRKSVFNEIRKRIGEWNLTHLFKVNLSELVITCKNGYQILFAGLDDVEKLKSITPEKGVITDVWVEEATEAAVSDIRQLMKRQRGGDENVPKRLTLSFNPIIRTHQIYKEYFEPIGWTDNQTEYTSEHLTILKTWYVHNKFLTAQDIHGLENEPDEYFFNVYTLGNWGTLGNVIFKNWEAQDLSGLEAQFTNTRHGLDFGYSSDPAALVSAHYDDRRKIIYIYGELYERELTNDELAARIKPRVGFRPVTCDSAEPKSIAELQQYGVNAEAAAKGKDSVLHGIQWLKQHTIIIDERCVNTQNEFALYQWKKDRTGEPTSKPVDSNNHIIDALRYAFEGDMGTQESPAVLALGSARGKWG